MIILSEYDITAAFQAIEDELIRSMIRNMKNHRVEEVENKKQWEMWQAKQLESLERYKKKNRKKYNAQFADIDSAIDRIIQQSYVQGGMEQEIEILNQIKKRYGNNIPSRIRRIKDTIASKVPVLGTKADKDFFQVDDKKLDALIHATKVDMAVGEHAMLRMANDQYRKTIFNAQAYALSGAGSYEKAVDMATKDFLSKGINCIQYKDGRRVNIKSYAEMSIRTAQKRAGLYADGEVRKKLGISTVITKKRLNACPKCLPFVDKILIDDVWSGGKIGDGPYPLVSNAIKAGFLHPNCKDHFSTYIEGITEPPEGGFTQDEIQQVGEAAKEEAKKRYAESQAEKFERLAEYSLDEDNKKQYKLKQQEWVRKYEGDIFDRIKGIFTKPDSELVPIKKSLEEGIQGNPSENVKNALSKSLSRVGLRKWDKPKSRYDETKKMIMVGSSADDRTIAHELFHEMDDEIGISKSRALLDTLGTDSELLIKRAAGYGNDIKNMIQLLYPDEFEVTELGNKVIKEEHRGLSDILHGLSYGDINMGYGHHKPGYWDTPLNVEREAWAQIGRSLYQNNPKDLEMLKDLLPGTYEKVLNILKEVDL